MSMEIFIGSINRDKKIIHVCLPLHTTMTIILQTGVWLLRATLQMQSRQTKYSN